MSATERSLQSATSRLFRRSAIGDRSAREDVLRQCLPRLRVLARALLPRGPVDRAAVDELARASVHRALTRQPAAEPRTQADLIALLRKALLAVYDETRAETTEPGGGLFIEDFVSVDTWQAYRRRLEALPGDLQVPLILFVECGMSHEEITRALETDDGAAVRENLALALAVFPQEAGDDQARRPFSPMPQGPEAPVETIFETLKDSFREDGEAVESLAGIERIREAFRTARSELEESPLPRQIPSLPGFRILEKVGEGSFGIVYQAIDEKLGREVALKVLSGDQFGLDSIRREGRRNFLHEARALASVDHPNVLKIHSVLERDGEVALVTEFLEGRSLDRLLEEAGPMGPGEAAHVGMEIARALAAVHAAGLVHRDVKSANILRKLGGRFVLTDFGEGLFYRRDGEPETIGAVAGTPLFMSPEQVRGQNVDPRSDIYSLGVVLYNLSTGELPYPLREDTKVSDLFQWITSGQKVPVRDRRPDLPELFVETIERALATAPEDRFQTAGELEGALLECVGRGRKRRPLSRPLAWGLAGLIPVVAGVIWWLTIWLSAVPFAAQFWLIGEGDEPIPLEDGSALNSEDRIYLDFDGRVPVNLYILCGDTRGNRVFLFPRQESQLANPVPAGRQRLPSVPGEAWKANAFSGNRMVFYIVGAEQPFLPLERALPSQLRLSPNNGPMESTPIDSDPAVKNALLDEVISDLDGQEEGGEFAADAWYLRFEFEVIPEAQSDGEEDSH